MHRFTAGVRAWLLGALLLAGVVASGCFCYSAPPPDSLIVDQPLSIAPAEDIYKELAPPRARPAPEVTEPEPAPEVPPPPPPTQVPPAVVTAIEDLSQRYPGLFVFDREKGLFRFNSDVTFDSGSAVVKPGPRAALGRLAQILNADQARDRRLTITGHTDSDRVRKPATIARLRDLGKSADNMGLSEARAESVAAVLMAGGIDASRIVTLGRGETAPIADNRSVSGKARNRRVEIYLTPGSASAGGAVPMGRVAFPSGR